MSLSWQQLEGYIYTCQTCKRTREVKIVALSKDILGSYKQSISNDDIYILVMSRISTMCQVEPIMKEPENSTTPIRVLNNVWSICPTHGCSYVESKIAAPQGNAVSRFVPFTAISVHSLTIPSLGVMKPPQANMSCPAATHTHS